MLRVGIYLRLSDEDKDKVLKTDVSESIKNQRNLLLEEISKHPDFYLVDEYSDEDLSGAGTYRPEFARLINDCKERKLDIVLCKSQSRFSRDMEIIEKYLHNKFLEWHIRFIGLVDNADTENQGNKKARQINGLVNEWYLEDVSNNIRGAFKAKMKQGEFISPFASFGYLISPTDNNKLIVDDYAKEIVKEIFKRYIEGYGLTSIAEYLNEHNIPSPSLYKYQNGSKLHIVSNRPREEIKWRANAIKTILTNEVYIGNLVQGKRTTVSYKNHLIRNKNKDEWIRIKHTHEAIIDEEAFNKVQNLIKERTKPIKKTGVVHIFSGKVYCLECHSIMRKKSSKNHDYLVCANNREGKNICSNKCGIRYDELEAIVLDKINNKCTKFYSQQEIINLAKNRKHDNKENILKTRQLTIQKEISTLDKLIENLYEDKVMGLLNISQFKTLVESYTKRKETYLIELKELNYEIDNLKHHNQVIPLTFNGFSTLNKVIIDEFIKNIYIGPLNKKEKIRNIKINWDFNN